MSFNRGLGGGTSAWEGVEARWREWLLSGHAFEDDLEELAATHHHHERLHVCLEELVALGVGEELREEGEQLPRVLVVCEIGAVIKPVAQLFTCKNNPNHEAFDFTPVTGGSSRSLRTVP